MNIQRLDYDEFTFEVSNSGDKYKLTKLDPLTGIKNNIELNLPNDNNFEVSSDGFIVYTGSFTTKVNIRLEKDGVYYLDGNVDGRFNFPIVNTLNINNYLFESAKNYICCCPTKPCNHSAFRQNDYVFNVVSNMVFSFLEYEFAELNTNVSNNIPVKEISEIIYRINEYLLTDNIPCQC